MNLLFLTEVFYPALRRGAEFATYTYAKLLARAGHNVVVVTNRFNGEPSVSSTEGFSIRRLHMFDEKAMKLFQYKYHALSRVDHLLSSHLRSLVKWSDLVYIPRFWYGAIPLAKAYGKPVIVHVHDYGVVCPISINYDVSRNAVCDRMMCAPRCVYSYEKMSMRSLVQCLKSTVANVTLGQLLIGVVELSDAILCVSNAQRRTIVKKRPSLEGRTKVIYNPMPAVSEVQMRGDDFGYFGGPLYIKGFDTLCRALLLLNRQGHKVTVHAPRLRVPNQRRTASPPNIVAYPDLNAQEVERIYERIRSVVVPPLCAEPLPYTVAEGLARGRFVIASNTGGIPEQVEGCKGALLVRPNSDEELAEAMDRVSALDREEIIDLGRQNREVFLKRFNNQNAIKQFIDVCERLC